jgi:hypothetical protein
VVVLHGFPVIVAMDWANALWAPEDADALHGFLFPDCDSQIVTFVSKMDAYDWPHTGRPPTAACFSEQAVTVGPDQTDRATRRASAARACPNRNMSCLSDGLDHPAAHLGLLRDPMTDRVAATASSRTRPFILWLARASSCWQAAATWQVIEPVADALGGTGGDVLGDLWFLLVSWMALRSTAFPRALNWLGLGVGAAALLSALPGLGILEVVVGLLQIAWFIWFGIITARIGSTESPLIG